MKRAREAESSRENPGEEVAVQEGEIETPEALLNDVVLQNIFKYLGYEDLKAIRDVKNTIWLRNSKKAWWSRSKVTLTKDKVEEYLNQTDINSCVKNYTMKYFRADDYHGFWEHFGHSIKYLELEYCQLGSVDDFRQIFYTKCPNLEKLVAVLLRLKTYTAAVEPMEWQEPQFGQQKNLKFLKLKFFDSMPLSWMEVLSHFPSLEGLETITNVDIYNVISIIRQQDPKMLKLKQIDITCMSINDPADSVRRVLLDRSLSFEKLHIGDGIHRLETLVDILDLHAKSLKELSISLRITSAFTQISLRQPLLNLEKLTLTACLFTANFLRYTPNLRKFHIFFGKDRNLLKCADSNLRFKTCKELSIDVSHLLEDLPNSDLEFLITAFPNVEILKISGLSNEKVSMFSHRWTKLVSLAVDDGVLDFLALAECIFDD